jgi:hypothetical protein
MKQLNDFKHFKVGEIREENNTVAEVVEIYEMPSGHIVIREKVTGNQEDIKAFQDMEAKQSIVEPIEKIEDPTPNKKWWQIWKGAQIK